MHNKLTGLHNKYITMITGKDITHKLYSVSEGLGAGVSADAEGAPAHLTRSASVDAVHEGARGRLRSLAWRTRSTSVHTKGK